MLSEGIQRFMNKNIMILSWLKYHCQHMKDQDTIVEKFYTELGHELMSLALDGA